MIGQKINDNSSFLYELLQLFRLKQVIQQIIVYMQEEITMEMNNTEIIAQIAALLSKLIENNNAQQDNKPAVNENAPVEMLTIKECAEAVSGLSEHIIRQLVAQEKIPYIRTGQGKRGKILINKAALLEYLKKTA